MKLEFTDQNTPLKFFDDYFMADNWEEVLKYSRIFDTYADKHPVYKQGWRVPLMGEARYLNRILYKLITEQATEKTIVFEACTYDGMLTSVLNHNGFKSFGSDFTPWPLLWKALDVDKYMRHGTAQTKKIPKIDVFIMLNWTQKIEPQHLLSVVDGVCGQKPPLCIFDRNASNRNPGMIPYYDDKVITDLGFEVIGYPKCFSAQHPGLQKEFLVWRSENATE